MFGSQKKQIYLSSREQLERLGLSEIEKVDLHTPYPDIDVLSSINRVVVEGNCIFENGTCITITITKGNEDNGEDKEKYYKRTKKNGEIHSELIVDDSGQSNIESAKQWISDYNLKKSVLRDLPRSTYVFEEEDGRLWIIQNGISANKENPDHFYKRNINENGEISSSEYLGSIDELEKTIEEYFGSKLLAQFYWRHCYQGVFVSSDYKRWHDYYKERGVYLSNIRGLHKRLYHERSRFKKIKSGLFNYLEHLPLIIMPADKEMDENSKSNGRLFTRIELRETTDENVSVIVKESGVYDLTSDAVLYLVDVPTPSQEVNSKKIIDLIKKRNLPKNLHDYIYSSLLEILKLHYKNDVAAKAQLFDISPDRLVINNEKIEAVISWLEKPLDNMGNPLELNDADKKKFEYFEKILNLHLAYVSPLHPDEHLSTHQYIKKLTQLRNELRPSFIERILSRIFGETDQYRAYRSVKSAVFKLRHTWAYARHIKSVQLDQAILHLEKKSVSLEKSPLQDEKNVRDRDVVNQSLLINYFKRLSKLLKLKSSKKRLSKKAKVQIQTDYKKINGLLKADSKDEFVKLDELERQITSLKQQLDIIDQRLFSKDEYELYKKYQKSKLTKEKVISEKSLVENDINYIKIAMNVVYKRLYPASKTVQEEGILIKDDPEWNQKINMLHTRDITPEELKSFEEEFIGHKQKLENKFSYYSELQNYFELKERIGEHTERNKIVEELETKQNECEEQYGLLLQRFNDQKSLMSVLNDENILKANCLEYTATYGAQPGLECLRYLPKLVGRIKLDENEKQGFLSHSSGRSSPVGSSGNVTPPPEKGSDGTDSLEENYIKR